MQTNAKAKRGRKPRLSTEGTVLRVITVRLPAEIHTAIATQRTGGKSLNQFCVDALKAALAQPDPAHPATPQI